MAKTGLAVLMLAGLAACGGGAGTQEESPAAALKARADLVPLPCGIAGAKLQRNNCFVEWLPAKAGEGRHFLIHHSDGGFRRFAISADGVSVDIADGASPLDLIGPKDGVLTFRVDNDIYDVPVQILLNPPA